MSQKVLLGKEAKEKIIEGAKTIYESVSTTMGPWGRNVLSKDEYGNIKSTKDGVSVAKQIKKLEDPVRDLGAQVIKQAAIKTVDSAGDGTTTSTVLSFSLLKNMLDIEKDINVTHLKRGIEDATKDTINYLKSISHEIDDEKMLEKIATLSANGDEEIGKLVSLALEKVGRDGVVTVEKSKSGETELEIVEGIQLDRGYKSPYFITDNDSMSCILNDPYILIYEKRLTDIDSLLPLLEKVSSENKSLLIIAEDIEGVALSTLLLNKGRGTLKVCAVKAPEFGDRRLQLLEDIAILTGGTVISEDRGHSLSSFDMNWLGKARTVNVNKEYTTLVDGKGEENKIKDRILSLKNLLDNTNSPYEIEKLQIRIGRLIGGVAIINVGGYNDIEIEEKKDRVEDALQAAKAAREEGILPGAGVTLFKYSVEKLKKFGEIKKGDGYNYGYYLLLKTLKNPLKKIIENYDGEVEFWFKKLEESEDTSLVPLLDKKELVNYLDYGIIDPTKVVKNALQNAVSAAISLLLTECVIYDNLDETKTENPEFNF